MSVHIFSLQQQQQQQPACSPEQTQRVQQLGTDHDRQPGGGTTATTPPGQGVDSLRQSLQQELAELSKFLAARPVATKAATAARESSVGATAAAAGQLPGMLGAPAASIPPASQAPDSPTAAALANAQRSLLHVRSVAGDSCMLQEDEGAAADGSLGEEAVAADALLDLEFAARDTGSFTRSRGRVAAAGLLPAVAASAAGRAALAAAAATTTTTSAAATGEEPAAPAAVAATEEETLDLPTQEDAAANTPAALDEGDERPAAATLPSAATPTAAPSAAGSAADAATVDKKEQLLALLAQHVSRAAGTTAAPPKNSQAAGSASILAAAAAAGSAPATSAGERQQFTCSEPGPSDAAAPVTADAQRLQALMQKVRQQLLVRQQVVAAATAAATDPAADSVDTSLAGRRALLQQLRMASQPSFSSRGAAAAAAAEGTAGAVPSLSAGCIEPRQHQHAELSSLARVRRTVSLPRSTSNITSNTAVLGLMLNAAGAGPSGAGPSSRMHAHHSAAQLAASAGGAPPAAGAGGAASGGPYASHLDADLLQLYSDFQSSRQMVRVLCAALIMCMLMQGFSCVHAECFSANLTISACVWLLLCCANSIQSCRCFLSCSRHMAWVCCPTVWLLGCSSAGVATAPQSHWQQPQPMLSPQLALVPPHRWASSCTSACVTSSSLQPQFVLTTQQQTQLQMLMHHRPASSGVCMSTARQQQQ